MFGVIFGTDQSQPAVKNHAKGCKVLCEYICVYILYVYIYIFDIVKF